MNLVLRTLIVLCILLVCGVIGYLYTAEFNKSSDELRQLAQQRYTEGAFKKAEQTAQLVLNREPDDPVMLLVAGGAIARQFDYKRAVKYLTQVSADADVWLETQLLLAGIYNQKLHLLSSAEKAYRNVLNAIPEHVEASTELARLLALTGRHAETVPLILNLIRMRVDTDLFILLLREEGVINDLERLQQALAADPRDPLPHLGLAWQAGLNSKFDIAIDHYQKAVQLNSSLPAAWTGLGKSLLSAHKYDKAIAWSNQLPESVENEAQIWLVRAELADQHHDHLGSIRCYLEAAQRAPHLKQLNAQLGSRLHQAGHHDLAIQFQSRLDQLQRLFDLQNKTFFSGQQPQYDDLLNVIEASLDVGQIWVAYHLINLAASIDPEHERFQQLIARLFPLLNDLPLQLTAPQWNIADKVDLSQFPLPVFDTNSTLPESQLTVRTDISLENTAAAYNLKYRYLNGTADGIQRRMYEFSGGGIGALDYDLDGYQDLYFTQGQAQFDGASSAVDVMFRNRFGKSFEQVEQAARLHSAGFGQGVSVGDLDSDGFPDIYVATTGINQLWLNNGDGTFSQLRLPVQSAWTTSCLIADLNGDTHPDLYDVNYVTGEDVFTRVCQYADGIAQLCSPAGFDAARDTLLISDGAGGYADQTETLMSPLPEGKGLGVMAWNTKLHGRLSLFVANDTTANFLYEPSESVESPQLIDTALHKGLAYNENGKAEACMGIAISDLNNDGRFDLHVTNYFDESNTLYMSTSDEFFIDQTRNYQLESPSLPMLSFGTHFVDLNLDGVQELFITSGHLDDLTRLGRPLKMAPQLFELTGSRFAPLPQQTQYFNQLWLGRAACLIDVNNDGIQEIAVGHLYNDYALLSNISEVRNHSLRIRLTGTTSSRDPVGTSIIATVNGQVQRFQLTAGSGYQASNEKAIVIGCGTAGMVENLTVRWPDQTEQNWTSISAPGDILIIQGQINYQTLDAE